MTSTWMIQPFACPSGAYYQGSGVCIFTVWAPRCDHVMLRIVSPVARDVALDPLPQGYWQVRLEGVDPNSQYVYQLDGTHVWPDPASHYQPLGVHQPSQVVDHTSFVWTDQLWRGLPLSALVIYELHVGTFTPEGTLAAIIPRLPVLKALGITAIEIMPIAAFPGARNWGYDGVYPYAVHHSYGGPRGLKQLVDACHALGLAVIVDVVYNHFGPEGNYSAAYGSYQIEKYKTPWGSAINFDDMDSDGVREFFLHNALYWFEHYHVDALRLDAVQTIYDLGANHFLAELARRVDQCSQQLGRQLYLIAESDLNDARLLHNSEQGGYGLDTQWSDDFHHALHTLLTQESNGYYQDFGNLEHLALAFEQGVVYTGQYSKHRRRCHGNDFGDCSAKQLVVYGQNHDQVGNRALGDRLSHLIPWPALKVAAAAVILSPFIPLLFMGEEYGEPNPFLFFISHTDPDLIQAVQSGRKRDFAEFKWQGEAPDPHSEATFQQSKIQWELHQEGIHQLLWKFYQRLLYLRREIPALAVLDKQSIKVYTDLEHQVLWIHRWQGTDQVVLILGFNRMECTVNALLPPGTWQICLDGYAPEWILDGAGSALPEQVILGQNLTLNPWHIALYQRR